MLISTIFLMRERSRAYVVAFSKKDQLVSYLYGRIIVDQCLMISRNISAIDCSYSQVFLHYLRLVRTGIP